MPGEKHVHEIFAAQDVSSNRIIAALAYPAFFLPLILRPYSAFAKFHANQGAALAVVFFGNIFLRMFLSFAPTLGDAIFLAVASLWLILCVYGTISALLGKAARLPLIGRLNLL